MSRYCDYEISLPLFRSVWYSSSKSEVSHYGQKQINRRIAAVKTADAINAIEGAPVSHYAKTLSNSWARGEITGEQMKAALLASHRKMAVQVQSHT